MVDSFIFFAGEERGEGGQLTPNPFGFFSPAIVVCTLSSVCSSVSLQDGESDIVKRVAAGDKVVNLFRTRLCYSRAYYSRSDDHLLRFIDLLHLARLPVSTAGDM